MTRKGPHKQWTYVLLAVCWGVASCSTAPSSDTIYSYAVYSSNSEDPGRFLTKEIILEENFRKEVTINYSRDLVPRDTIVEYFKVTRDSVYKIITREGDKYAMPFLTIASMNCVRFEFPEEENYMFDTEYCFLEKTPVISFAGETIETYRFSKVLGHSRAAHSIVFLDSEFRLIKEEYYAHDSLTHKIVRVRDFRNSNHD